MPKPPSIISTPIIRGRKVDSENEIADQEAIEPEEHDRDIQAPELPLKKSALKLRLFRIKFSQVLRAKRSSRLTWLEDAIKEQATTSTAMPARLKRPAAKGEGAVNRLEQVEGRAAHRDVKQRHR